LHHIDIDFIYLRTFLFCHPANRLFLMG